MTAACAGLRRLADYVAVEVTVTLMEILGPLCRIRLPTRHDAGLALLVDLNVDGERGAADAHNLGVTADEVADEDRPVKFERIHRYRHHASLCAAKGGDARGDVDLRHDPAAEDVAGEIGVGGHGQDAQRGFSVRRQA